MADLEALKQKYAPVVATIQEFSTEGATVEDESLAGDKLHLKATVPSQVVANRVWDSIKAVDPTFADLQHEIVTSGGAEQPYTIQSGDNLSKISKKFYGSPNHYQKIAEANGIDDPNKIQAGQQINLPVLS
jgi:nucleoid-associated protein YgaU